MSFFPLNDTTLAQRLKPLGSGEFFRHWAGQKIKARLITYQHFREYSVSPEKCQRSRHGKDPLDSHCGSQTVRQCSSENTIVHFTCPSEGKVAVELSLASSSPRLLRLLLAEIMGVKLLPFLRLLKMMKVVRRQRTKIARQEHVAIRANRLLSSG